MADVMDFATGWGSEDMPKSEGDTLIGVVTELSMGGSEYGTYPILVITLEKPVSNKVAGDNVAIHCFHTALRNKVEELQPEIGETIGVRYHGKRVAKDGKRSYDHYTAKMIGRSGAGFWTQNASTPEPRQLPTVQSDIPYDESIPF